MINNRFQNSDMWIQDRSWSGGTYFLDEPSDVTALCTLLNRLDNKIIQLEEQTNKLEEDLDYYKSRCGTLEKEYIKYLDE